MGQSLLPALNFGTQNFCHPVLPFFESNSMTMTKATAVTVHFPPASRISTSPSLLSFTSSSVRGPQQPCSPKGHNRLTAIPLNSEGSPPPPSACPKPSCRAETTDLKCLCFFHFRRQKKHTHPPYVLFSGKGEFPELPPMPCSRLGAPPAPSLQPSWHHPLWGLLESIDLHQAGRAQVLLLSKLPSHPSSFPSSSEAKSWRTFKKTLKRKKNK